MQRFNLILFFLLSIVSQSRAQWQGLSIQQVIPTEKPVYLLSLTSHNKDGSRDLIALPTDPFEEVMIYHGDALNEFTFSSKLVKNESYRLIQSGDLDDDGIDDLVLSSYWSNGFKIYWSNKDGTFTEGNHYGLTGHGKNIKLVDIDSDNDLDIIAFSGGSGQPITLHLFTNSGARSLSQRGIFPSALHTDKRIQIVDKNKDGLLDIMVASSFPWFVIFYQNADGSFIPRYWPHKFGMPFTSEYYLADLNNDSKQDIIANFFESGFRFYEGLNDTLFSEQYKVYEPSFKAFRVFTTDLNRDGSTDIVVQHQNQEYEPTDSILYLLGNGDFTFQEPQLVKFPSRVEVITVDDFNADSFPDIIAYTTNHGIVTVLNKGVVTGVEDEFDMMNVFPNPFNHYLNFENLPERALVIIFDIQGKMIHSSILNEKTIDTSSWAQGFYVVKVISGAKGRSFKVVRK